MRNMNSYTDSRLSSKINKINEMVGSKMKKKTSHPLSTSIGEPDMISFRPQSPQDVDQMGCRIKYLKSQLTDLCE